MDENKLKHLSSWDGNAFINRYGSYAPWYDDKADYNTNAKSYYDYLARINQYLKIMQETINKLIDRDLKFEDTNTIDFTQIGKWIEQDVMTVTANVKISLAAKKQMIGYLEYSLKNAIKPQLDGLYAPDYTQVIQDMRQELDHLNFVNDKDFVFYMDGKVRDKINTDQDLLPAGVDLSSTNEEVNEAYKKLTTTDIYAYYDQLQKDNHKYSQAITWGYTGDGRPLKYYIFEARNRWNVPKGYKNISRFDDYNNLRQTANVFFCTSGQHGDEKANTFALALSVRDIINGQTNIDKYVRDNFDLVILPVCNPYGFDHNVRDNENGVNINRNYPYQWEQTDAKDKGKEPLSEKGAQFITSVRNAYNQQKYKNGMALIDFHDFDDRMHSDGRLLWTSTNDQDFRQSIIKTGNNVYNTLIKNSQLIRDNIQSGWLHIGSTGVGSSTLNADNYWNGYKSTLCEVPTFLNYLDPNTQFATTTGLIAYTIVKSFILNTCMDMVGKTKRLLTGFKEISTNKNDSLLDIALSIPNGGYFNLGVFEDIEGDQKYRYLKDLPKNDYGKLIKGILMIYRSSNHNSGSGYMTYVSMGRNANSQPRLYLNSFSNGKLRQWVNISDNSQANMSKISDVDTSFKRASVTIDQLASKMNPNSELKLLVNNDYTKIKKQIPKEIKAKDCYLKITKLNVHEAQIELTSFIKDFQKFLSYTNSQGLHDWKELTN